VGHGTSTTLAAKQAVNIDAMTTLMTDSLAHQRFYTRVLSVFSLVALILAMAGLGGTLLYDARLRQHELGVRMALGAPADRMARSVFGEALTTVGLGGVLGLVAYLPLRRFTQSVVPGVDAIDPTTLALFALLLVGSVVVASWIPARLVAATDPVRALRGDRGLGSAAGRRGAEDCAASPVGGREPAHRHRRPRPPRFPSR